MAKWYKICGLYILKVSIIVVHSSSVSDQFHDKNKLGDLRLRHGRCMKIVLENFSEFFK